MTNRLEVVSDPDQAEHANVVVCMRLTQPLLLPDNAIALCSECGEAVQHRPHIPTTPKIICWPCAMPIVEQEAAKGELAVMITPKTAREFAEYLARKGRH